MKGLCATSLLAFTAGLTMGAAGQSTSSPVTTALQTSTAAMLGTTPIRDVTLNGTAEAIAGSDDENGTFTFRAMSTGASRIDIAVPSGTKSETRQPGNGAPVGSWSNGSSVNALAQHNLLTGICWPFPAFTLENLLNSTAMTVTFVAQEGSLVHFSAAGALPGASPAATATQQQLSQIDFWLDSTTFLPAKMLFNIHPDVNAELNIPVLIEFSNYQTLSGILTPSHVQKFVNNTLVLDVHVQSVAINSGLPATTFTLP